MNDVTLHLGDCLEIMPSIETASVDAIVTDPPYPCIKRSYGYWTEEQWFAMMRPLVAECRRVLKPTGSAVFILQPNSERVGRMRTWLWEFMVWVGKEWGIVQDAYWWNTAAMPTIHQELLRASVKSCVWVGIPSCYRSQDGVLWTESQANVALRQTARAGQTYYPSGHHRDEQKISGRALERGGVTPFNLIPVANTDSTNSAGSKGHGAGTPLALMRWWTRYICPPGGTVLDPFSGSGTGALAALAEGRRAIGIERNPEYYEIATWRVKEAQGKFGLFAETNET